MRPLLPKGVLFEKKKGERREKILLCLALNDTLQSMRYLLGNNSLCVTACCSVQSGAIFPESYASSLSSHLIDSNIWIYLHSQFSLEECECNKRKRIFFPYCFVLRLSLQLCLAGRNIQISWRMVEKHFLS